MKILHIMEYYAVVGGLERGVRMICDLLEEAGHTCSVVFSHAGAGELPTTRPAYYMPELAEPHCSGAIVALGRVLDREMPDLIVIHEFLVPDVLEWVMARYPSIRYVWGFKLLCPGGRRMWTEPGIVCQRKSGYLCQAVAYRERCMPRNPRQGLPLIARTLQLGSLHRMRSDMIVPSEFMKQLLLREGFDSARVHCLPLCTVLPPAAVAPAENPHQIFCAARLRQEKGVHVLLEAVATLPHLRVTIAGDGQERAALEAQAHRLGLADRVTFTGWLGVEAVAAQVKRSAVVVVPSIWPEPFGLVGIEAMAHARPVVAFDVGGIKEWLVPGETGLLVPPGDVTELRHALALLTKNHGLAMQLGQRARSVAERRFSPAVYRNALLPIISNLCPFETGKLARAV